MTRRIHPAEIFTSLLILLFAYTAISKILDFNKFRRVLSESPLIHNGAGIIAWLLPATELLIVLLLFLPRYRITGLWISLGMLTVFTGYLFYMLLFASHLPCSCGGVLSSLSWKEHLVFNVVFLGINTGGLIGLRFSKHKNITE